MSTPPATVVAVAWLRQLAPVVAADAGVASTLPSIAQWDGDLFIVVTPAAAGPVDGYTPLRSPTVQVDVFAKATRPTGRPAIGRAAALAEAIHDATTPFLPVTVTVPAAYPPARVTDVAVRRGAQERDDPTNLARVSLDLGVTYITTQVGDS